MSDSQNNRIPDLPANGATISQIEQLLQIWQGNLVHQTEWDKEAVLIKKKVVFLDHTITSMTAIIIEQAGTI